MATYREGGDLSRKSGAPRRVWLLVNIVVTAALLPALFTARASADGPHEVRAGAPGGVAVALAPVAAGTTRDYRAAIDALAPLPTTTTTAPPPTTAPPTTVVLRPRATTPPVVRKAQAPAPTTTTTANPPTTTTAKPAAAAPTTTAAPAQPKARAESGKATWYHQQSGVCAHKTLPFGTVVTITNTRNGKTTTCRVGDRGPFVAGYIIDLAPEQFDEVSPRSAGVFPTRITW